jgi:high-affinity nickel-transport protein
MGTGGGQRPDGRSGLSPAAPDATARFSRPEWLRLGGFYGTILLFHVVGWGLFLHYGSRMGPVYAGAGGLAYSLGLRHAFDADHISAVDDTTRWLMQRGKRPLGTGFFFSLGHSTVVVALAVGIAAAAQAVRDHLPTFQRIGGTIGATVSATFLVGIAVLDFFVLLGVLAVWRKAKTGLYEPEQLDELMTQRGFINRVLGSRWRGLLSESWHMYPVGFLFGLGFDTASEVGLLALTTAAAAGAKGVQHTGGGAPVGAVLALPLLFTAGMTLMDTTDGVFMMKAYGWAFSNPIRKVYYNLATVSLGVFVAGMIGVVEYMQVLAEHAGLHGPFWDWIGGLDFEMLGYFIVGTFILCWIGSVVLYRVRRIDERYGAAFAQRG